MKKKILAALVVTAACSGAFAGEISISTPGFQLRIGDYCRGICSWFVPPPQPRRMEPVPPPKGHHEAPHHAAPPRERGHNPRPR